MKGRFYRCRGVIGGGKAVFYELLGVFDGVRGVLGGSVAVFSGFVGVFRDSVRVFQPLPVLGRIRWLDPQKIGDKFAAPLACIASTCVDCNQSMLV